MYIILNPNIASMSLLCDNLFKVKNTSIKILEKYQEERVSEVAYNGKHEKRFGRELDYTNLFLLARICLLSR